MFVIETVLTSSWLLSALGFAGLALLHHKPTSDTIAAPHQEHAAEPPAAEPEPVEWKHAA